MIRPKTPRRGAHRTMQILKSIKSFFGNQIEIQIFGCSDSDIELFGLERDFLYKNFGVLRRRNVADVLRSSDIFLDLSDYQAFGRTALEAMACGCVVVITHNGGIYEYATHNENSVIVDVTNIEHCIDEISKIIKSPDLRKKLANNALLKAAEYSPIKAARSELEVISQKTRTMEKNNSHYLNKNNVRNIVLDDSVKILGILSRTETGYTGSAYIRLLLPLKHNTISKKLSFVPGRLDDLSVYKPQAVLVQRTAISNKEDAINLVNYCKNNRVKIIYETDDDLFEIASSGSSHPEAQKYSSWTLGAKVIATHADLITVSSTNLKQKMIGFNHKTEVLYNSLDENLWQINNTINRSRNSPNEQIGILYMGTNTHGEDFLLIEESLKKIHRKYKNQIRFDIIGVSNMKFDTSYLNPIYVPKGCTEYPNFVKWLYENSYRWEIGLAPLANTEFNRCKSFIKFLDYSALGLASICTKIEPYEIIIKDGINGILVENDVDSWFVAIDGLINDSVRRKTISRNAFSTLKTKHTLKTNSRIWLDTYFSLFNL
jgi:glycosyltransferase involved in cell wall biosynthesis